MEKIKNHDHHDKQGNKLDLYYNKGKLFNAYGQEIEAYYDEDGRRKIPYINQWVRVWRFCIIGGVIILLLAGLGVWLLLRALF
jgi:hypothetical protein